MLPKGLEVRVTGGSAAGCVGIIDSDPMKDSMTTYYSVKLEEPSAARSGAALPKCWAVYEKDLAPLDCSGDPNLAFRVSRRIP